MAPEKRKKPANSAKQDAKKARLDQPTTEPREACASSLLGPHEAAIAKLQSKYNVLAASIISSSQIRKRVSYVTKWLTTPLPEQLPTMSTDRNSLVLVHARPADVCKLITVVELCKRVLKEEGKHVYQYNQLFQPPPVKQKSDRVEETVLVGNEDEYSSSEDDAFEPIESRLEKAMRPTQQTHEPRSMRVYLSCTPVPELKNEPGVTVQSSETTAAATASRE